MAKPRSCVTLDYRASTTANEPSPARIRQSAQALLTQPLVTRSLCRGRHLGANELTGWKFDEGPHAAPSFSWKPSLPGPGSGPGDKVAMLVTGRGARPIGRPDPNLGWPAAPRRVGGDGGRRVDVINTFRVSAGHFAYFRVVSRTEIRRFRRSFLKERGRSRPADWLFSLLCGLPGPGLGALK